MMQVAQGNGKFIAHFSAQGFRLGEAQMVGMG
jgi:hypothetical protein